MHTAPFITKSEFFSLMNPSSVESNYKAKPTDYHIQYDLTYQTVQKAVVQCIKKVKPDLLKTMWERGLDVNELLPYYESGPEGAALHMAAELGSTFMLGKILEQKNVNIDIKSGGQTLEVTPLMIAIQNNRLECARALLDKGADINVVDNNQNTILMHTILLDNADKMLDLLLTSYPATKSLLHHKNAFGDSFLMICLGTTNEQIIISTLLEQCTLVDIDLFLQEAKDKTYITQPELKNILDKINIRRDKIILTQEIEFMNASGATTPSTPSKTGKNKI